MKEIMRQNYLRWARGCPLNLSVLGSIGLSVVLVGALFGESDTGGQSKKKASGDSIGTHGAKRGVQLFSDTFERAELGDEWIEHFKEVSIKDGVLVVHQVPDHHPAIARHKMDLGNAIFEFDMRFVAKATRGLLVVNGDEHVFHVSFRETAKVIDVSLKDYYNPENTVDVKVPVSKANAWHAITLVLVDDQLEAIVDGHSVVTLKSPGLAGKKTLFQLNGVGQHMEYDNVDVWSVAPLKDRKLNQ